MYYADLSHYDYGEIDAPCSVVLNVGWLDRSMPFAAGPVVDSFSEAVGRLSEPPIHLTRGSHPCGFCLHELQQSYGVDLSGRLAIQRLGELEALGNGEIVVRGEGDVCYVAPTLIGHYVVSHGYSPPRQFIEAVMRRAG